MKCFDKRGRRARAFERRYADAQKYMANKDKRKLTIAINDLVNTAYNLSDRYVDDAAELQHKAIMEKLYE